MSIEGKINFLTIYSRKLEECREFYTTLLGRPLTQEQHGTGPVHYSTQIGDAIIEFYPTRGEATKLRIGVLVDSLEETLSRMRYGYKTEIPTNSSETKESKRKKIIIPDPEKRLVEVQEREI